jgi:outer membrane protein TolC
MGSLEHHLRLSREKRDAALEEYEKKRYTVVGDLAIKAVEQAIEALASLEGAAFPY